MTRAETRESVREARNAVYRQLVFDAAEMTFAVHGFEATKIQDIADRAGISVGVLYGVFSGKQELFEAIHEERGRALIARVGAEVEAAATPLAKILTAVGAAIRFFAAPPHYLRLHLREATAWAYPELGTDIQATTWKQAHRIASQIFEEGMRDGTLVPEEPGYAARMLMAMAQVQLADWYQGGMKADVQSVIARLEALARRAFAVEGRGR